MIKNKQKIMTNKYWCSFNFYYYSIRNTLDRACVDYFKITNGEAGELMIDVGTAKYVYMQYVIAEMAKIIGLNKVDQFGLKKLISYLLSWKNGLVVNCENDIFEIEATDKLKNNIDAQIKRIVKVLNENNGLIEKLKINRNKLGSHVQIEERGGKDLPLSELKLSPKAHRSIYDWRSDDEYKKIKDGQEMNISSNLSEQRYHYKDLEDDIPRFGTMIDEFTNIVEEVNYLVYLNLK